MYPSNSVALEISDCQLACYGCGYAALKNLVDEISRSYAACAAYEELDDETANMQISLSGK